MGENLRWAASGNLLEKLEGLDRKNLRAVAEELAGEVYRLEPSGSLSFVHIQGSPGAYPASVLKLEIPAAELGLSEHDFENEAKALATFDFVLRHFQLACSDHTLCRPNRGDDGSGSWQQLAMPQQVLRWNAIDLKEGMLEVFLIISLPSSTRGNCLKGDQAAEMLGTELPAVLSRVEGEGKKRSGLQSWQQTVEDYYWLQGKLPEMGLVAFIADGSVLPRRSGISDLPLVGADVVPFHAPDKLAVEIDFPNAGSKRGIAIENGVTAIVGGGFHGKSTLLEALCKAEYPHIPGDGREYVICSADSMYVRAEDGRAVHGVDISPFIRNLPMGKDTRSFSTQDASGSTSQASAIVEAVCAGADVLLLDEDSSATNFLVRDDAVRQLVPGDPIVPLIDRLGQMKDRYGLSVVIVVGSNSEYFPVADRVIEMSQYLPRDVTEKAWKLVATRQREPGGDPIVIEDRRKLAPGNFSPAFYSERHGRGTDYRVKVRRAEPSKVEIGDDLVDLTADPAAVAQEQVLCTGRLLASCEQEEYVGRSPSELSDLLHRRLAREGMHTVQGREHHLLALPRRLEIAAAINRLRNLRLERD